MSDNNVNIGRRSRKRFIIHPFSGKDIPRIHPTMKRLIALALGAFFAVVALAEATDVARSQAVTVTKLTITFRTTSDDKDWNTQVHCRIVAANVDVARLSCCSADREKDHWDGGSTESRDLEILQTIDKANLLTYKLILGSRADQNDKWDFVPSLHIEYSDGTAEDRTYTVMTLNSRNGRLDEKLVQI